MSLLKEKTINEDEGLAGAARCLYKHPVDFFAQAMDGVWLSTLGCTVEVSEPYKRKCKDCAKLVVCGLFALSCLVIGAKGCSDAGKSPVQQTTNVLSNQGR